jgi:RNA polymerase sigma factor (sigma-70 family)
MTETAPTFPAPDADEDLLLARRVAGGDCLAFELLMRRHNRRLFRLARATLRNDAEAEDALQEAYLTAYRCIGEFRGEAALGTWLSRLVLNECLGRMRRQTRRDNIFPIRQLDNETELDDMPRPDIDSPENEAGRAETRALLERKLDALPEAFRLVFVLRCVEEMTVEETARYLDIPEATVRSRLFRAKKLLRESMAKEFEQAQQNIYEFGGIHCDRVVRQVLSRLTGQEIV